MKKLLLLLAPVLVSSAANARSWDINIENGASFARLLPSSGSTKGSGSIKYGFGSPGIYIGPSVSLVVSEHSKFNFGYQYSENQLGVKFLVNGSAGSSAEDYDVVDLHNISGGYYYSTAALREKIRVGFFAKMGIAYGHMSGYGGGGSASAVAYDGEISMGEERLTGFEVMPDFWMPNNTLGFTIGTNSRSKLADRLAFNISATMNWKNAYKDYSRTHYSIETTSYKEEGIVRYQGIPLQMQMGISYAMFRIGS